MTTVPQNDPTLNPSLRSWVEPANDSASEFPIQNLPLCRFLDAERRPKIGVGIGTMVVDVDLLFHAGWFGEDERAERVHRAVHSGVANYLMADPDSMRWMRQEVQRFLLDGPAGGQQARRLREKGVVEAAGLTFMPPCVMANYTDFYASVHHATNVGSMFRPDNPLLPNYKHVPIGYHGRASSIVAGGTPVRRPMGQTHPDESSPPAFGPSKRLDYEMEVGCVIGSGNALGASVPIGQAPAHVAGLVLVNDWSARDVQAWEYQPLGPFLAKNFATTVSPWLVTMDALRPFIVDGPARRDGDPQPLEYLRPTEPFAFDVEVTVAIRSAKMREANAPAHVVSRGNLKDMFWTFAQMIAHHTSNGCNLQPGDLLASGTISGPTADSRGCMLELTWAGNGPDGKPLPRKPVELPGGEKRTFLEDGDEVIMTGACRREGFRSIGFGRCAGVVLPAQG